MHDVASDSYSLKATVTDQPKLHISTANAPSAATSSMTEASDMKTKVNHNEKSSSSTSTKGGADGKDKNLAGAKGGKEDKRYIPPYKKPDAALTFPEKVRRVWTLLIVCEKCQILTWYRLVSV